jgi:hypothetical protein
MELIFAVGVYFVNGVLMTLFLTSFFLIDSHPLAKHRGKILVLIISIFVAAYFGVRNV